MTWSWMRRSSSLEQSTSCRVSRRSSRLGDGIAARVIVQQDDGRGGLEDGRLEDFSRVHQARRQRALRDDHVAQEPVLGVEQRHAEHLLLEVLHQRPVAREDLLRAREHHAARPIARPEPPRDLERGGEPDRAHAPDASDMRQLRHPETGDRGQRAVLRQDLARHVHGRQPRHAGAKLDGEELGVGERLRALVIQPLARPVFRGPLPDLKRATHVLPGITRAEARSTCRDRYRARASGTAAVAATSARRQPVIVIRRGSSPRPVMATVMVRAGSRGKSLSAHSTTVTPSPWSISSTPMSASSVRLRVR